jgi:hypothetical protein
MFSETTPAFRKDLPMIVDLLPNYSKEDKEKLLRELGAMEEEVEDVPECTPEEISEIESNFFLAGDDREKKITQLEAGDEKTDDKPFYIKKPETKKPENKKAENKKDKPKKTQSQVRNALLAAAGLVAMIGIGSGIINNLGPNNTGGGGKNPTAPLSSTNNGSPGAPLATANNKEPDAAIQEPLAAVQEEPDATVAAVQEEPDATVAAVQEEPDATVAAVQEEPDAAVAAVQEEPTSIPAIPFLKEKSMKMTVSTIVTEYGDTLIDFDGSLAGWEESGWERLEAFHHSPTKQGWILRNDETTVFILQQLLEENQATVLAYIQPKTW